MKGKIFTIGAFLALAIFGLNGCTASVSTSSGKPNTAAANTNSAANTTAKTNSNTAKPKTTEDTPTVETEEKGA